MTFFVLFVQLTLVIFVTTLCLFGLFAIVRDCIRFVRDRKES